MDGLLIFSVDLLFMSLDVSGLVDGAAVEEDLNLSEVLFDDLNQENIDFDLDSSFVEIPSSFFKTSSYRIRNNSQRHENITLAPMEYPTRVTGRLPCGLCNNARASSFPARSARITATVQALSIIDVYSN